MANSFLTFNSKERQQSTSHSPYRGLQAFQEKQKQLNILCDTILKLINICCDRSLISHDFLEEGKKVDRKLKSPSFRVAVIGDFSRGKSTLLNALLGAEIQAVRSIPCSATMTILRYGDREKIICRYKDSSEEELTLQQYKEKSTIPKKVALNINIDRDLLETEIEEIIFESPDLELCRNGVEIIDSPGLNEHPDRTAITNKLIQDTDAVIFLLSAMQPLTQSDRDLLQDLKLKLNGNKETEAASNLFIIVNYMDIIRNKEDRQDIRERVENFIVNDRPLITGENRIHYLSAQAALDAILDESNNEYLTAFQNFTRSLESFFIQEIGMIKLSNSVDLLSGLIQKCEREMANSLEDCQKKKLETIELIAELKAYQSDIFELGNEIIDESVTELARWWNYNYLIIFDSVVKNSEIWTSQAKDVKTIVQDYITQFNNSLSQEINERFGTEVIAKRLQPRLAEFKLCHDLKIELVKSKLGDSHDSQLFSYVGFGRASVNLYINNTNIHNRGFGKILFKLSGGGLIASVLLTLTGLGLIPVAVVSAATWFEFRRAYDKNNDEYQAKLKEIIIDRGREVFSNSRHSILKQMDAIVRKFVKEKYQTANIFFDRAVSMLDNSIEKIDRYHQEKVQQFNLIKDTIAETTQKLEIIKQDIDDLKTK